MSMISGHDIRNCSHLIKGIFLTSLDFGRILFLLRFEDISFCMTYMIWRATTFYVTYICIMI